MFNHLKTALLMMIILTLLTGLVYPFAITFLAQVIFPYQANGSLIIHDKKIIGSKLIGQNFTSDKYFHSRPSEVNYEANKSGGSNFGPTNKKLIEKVRLNVEKLKRENLNLSVPADLVTSSASGLDPHISVEAALFQVLRVAKARGISEGKIKELVSKHIEPRQFGILGEPRVNVLILNLALDNL